MYRVKTYNKISEKGLGLFNTETYSVSPDTESPEAIILRSYKLEEDSINNNICCIARAGAGVNNIPVQACSENGIVVFNTPGANANAVKEMVVCGLFLASRDVTGALAFSASLDKESDVGKTVEGNKSKFKGPEIKGKSLGVIGLGAIGVMVANTARELGMEVYGYDPFLSIDHAWELNREVHKVNGPDEIYKKCDYITIHVPLISSTKGLVNSEVVSQMKEGTRLLNFSRGGLVDDDAVLEGIASGKIARYVTDFPDVRLLGNPNVVCIPHLGASTYESEINCAVMAVNQIKDYLENGNIVNSVNYPGCSIVPGSPTRICIIHRNAPEVLSQISAILAQDHINIDNLINKAREDYAYTIVDTDSEIDEKVKANINSIDGVIKVRVIDF
ncbi:MAG: phosphoglycerate dehydrogenase [Clostridiales bacterium]|nr:phosphoglycerate dehydrogenase [Clostridiales bacterium]